MEKHWFSAPTITPWLRQVLVPAVATHDRLHVATSGASPHIAALSQTLAQSAALLSAASPPAGLSLPQLASAPAPKAINTATILLDIFAGYGTTVTTIRFCLVPRRGPL